MFRYQWEPTKLVLPPSAAANLRNGHGVTRDKTGRIYFTYESFNKSDPAVGSCFSVDSWYWCICLSGLPRAHVGGYGRHLFAVVS